MRVDKHIVEQALILGDKIEALTHDEVERLITVGELPKHTNKARIKYVAYALNVIALGMSNARPLDDILQDIRAMYREAVRTENDTKRPRRTMMTVIDGGKNETQEAREVSDEGPDSAA